MQLDGNSHEPIPPSLGRWKPQGWVRPGLKEVGLAWSGWVPWSGWVLESHCQVGLLLSKVKMYFYCTDMVYRDISQKRTQQWMVLNRLERERERDGEPTETRRQRDVADRGLEVLTVASFQVIRWPILTVISKASRAVFSSKDLMHLAPSQVVLLIPNDGRCLLFLFVCAKVMCPGQRS